MIHCQRPARSSPAFGVQVVVCDVVVPTLAALLTSAYTECLRAPDDCEVPCMPPEAEIPPPMPMKLALASAVTDAFQPLSSELESSAALLETDLEESLFVIPTV